MSISGLCFRTNLLSSISNSVVCSLLQERTLVGRDLLGERGLFGLESGLGAVGGLHLVLEGLVLLLEEGRSQRDLVLLQPAGLARPTRGKVVLQPLLPVLVVLVLRGNVVLKKNGGRLLKTSLFRLSLSILSRI